MRRQHVKRSIHFLTNVCNLFRAVLHFQLPSCGGVTLGRCFRTVLPVKSFLLDVFSCFCCEFVSRLEYRSCCLAPGRFCPRALRPQCVISIVCLFDRVPGSLRPLSPSSVCGARGLNRLRMQRKSHLKVSSRETTNVLPVWPPAKHCILAVFHIYLSLSLVSILISFLKSDRPHDCK